MAEGDDQDPDRTVRATPEVSDPDATVVGDGAGEGVANGDGGFPSIPGYRITARIGVGGMGVVWKAEQESTRREVALKLLDARGADSEEMLGRFEREVELAARLEHPHITRVYDSGLHTGGCYYAMEFVDGVPLDRYVRERELAPDDVLALMEKVCAAVQYAHQNGVIHRDLKPDNILVDDEGNPHVLDFGLAKVMDEQRQTLMLSMEGDLLGTPAFMAPEQAQGHAEQTDTRTDAYSLGVILFNLLTNEFPHDTSGGALDIVNRVAHEEPRRPREFLPTIDADVEAILLKALSREPNRRYATAGNLADDIRAHLNGDPVSAQPPTLRYFLAKRLRKHRAIVAGVAALLLLAIGGVVFYIHSIKAEQARTAAEQVKTAAQRDRADENAQTARENEKRANARAEEARRNLYFAHIGLAHNAWKDGDPQRADEELNKCPVDLRHWEWRYLKGLTTRMKPRKIWFRKHQAGRPAAMSPDGQWIAFPDDKSTDVMLLRRSALAALHRLRGHQESVARVIFDPQSKRLASGDDGGNVKIWGIDCHTAADMASSHGKPVTALEFSPDGSRLASAGEDERVVLWDSTNGKQMVCISAHTQDLAFTPDGSELVTAGFTDPEALEEGLVCAWDASSGKPIRTICQGNERNPYNHCVGFSQDGELVACGRPVRFEIRNYRTGEKVFARFIEFGNLWTTVLHPDGDHLLVGMGIGWLGCLSRFNLETKQEELRLQGPLFGLSLNADCSECVRTRSGVLEIQPLEIVEQTIHQGVKAWLSPSGRDSAVLQWDGSVLVSDLLARIPIDRLHRRDAAATWADFSSSGDTLAVGYDDGVVCLRDLKTGEESSFAVCSGMVRRVQFSADGASLLTAGEDLRVAAWELPEQRLRWEQRGPKALPYNLEFSPCGMYFAGLESPNVVSVCDGTTGDVLWQAKVNHPSGGRSPAIAWSAGNSYVAILHWFGIDVYTGTGGELVASLKRDGVLFRTLKFSSDGKRLFAVGRQNRMAVWDAGTWTELMRCDWTGDTQDYQLSASSDNGSVVVSSVDGHPCSQIAFLRDGAANKITPRESVDLIPLVSIREDARVGEWRREGETIVSPDIGGRPHLVLPAVIHGDYRVRLRLKQLSGNDSFVMHLPVNNHVVRLILGGWPNLGFCSGLDLVDGRRGNDNDTTVRGFRLGIESEHTIQVEVRTDDNDAGICVEVDGKPHLKWHGKADRLGVLGGSVMGRVDEIAIGNHENSIVFSNIELEMLKGEAWLTRVRPRADIPSFAPGERVDLLRHVVPQRHTVKGEWQVQDGELVAESAKPADRLFIPVVPRGSYVLRAEFTRSASVGDKTIGFILPLGHRQVSLSFQHWGRDVSGLDRMGGIPVGTTGHKLNPTDVIPGELEDGRRYCVEASVRACGNSATVRVQLDGDPYLSWMGPMSSCSLGSDCVLPIPDTFGIRVGQVSVTFHKLELEMLDGRAYVPRGL